MKERPILMNAPMVRALLDGTKTQTRRIAKEFHGLEVDAILKRYPNQSGCPYGKPGDHLWVREKHRPIFGQTCGLIAVDYQANPQEKWERMRDHAGKPKWTSSIHMRREYSRIQLEIVSVRVERLQAISEVDAKAEGVAEWARGACADGNPHGYTDVGYYSLLWEQINGADSWDANPWVWVIEFMRVAP